MKQPELGRKLKEARLAKKLTQSEVVGTFITRNMLSLIESGKAMPSVESLQFLAEVLEIPLQTLISSPSPLLDLPEPAELDARKLHQIDELVATKKALHHKEYAAVLERRDDVPIPFEDEYYALFAKACYGLAKQKYRDGHIEEAAALASDAMEYSAKGVYADELLHSKVLVLFNRSVTHLPDGEDDL